MRNFEPPLQNKQDSSLTNFFKPSFLKLFLPILIFLLILISFGVNTHNAPEIGDYLCKSSQNEKFYVEHHDEMYKGPLKSLVEGNIYFFFSYTHKLNPFFPMPCEAVESGFGNSKYCGYYISEESYNCILDPDSNFRSLSFGEPPYKKISFLKVLLQGVIISLIIYIIICAILLAKVKISEQSEKTLIWIYVSGIFISLAGFFISPSPYFFITLGLFVIFMIFELIKSERVIKIIFSILSILLLVSLMVGIFVIEYIFSRVL